jgi:hypothetical protein
MALYSVLGSKVLSRKIIVNNPGSIFEYKGGDGKWYRKRISKKIKNAL